MGRILQWTAALLASVGGFFVGTIIAWPHFMEYQLVDAKEAHFEVSYRQFFWLDIIPRIIAMIGCLIVGSVLDILGRKYIIMASYIPYIIGYILITAARNYAMIISGRVLLGLAMGGLSTVIPIYVGEIAERDIRGALGCLYHILYCLGTFFACLLAYFVRALVFNIVLLALPLFFVPPFAFMPESPMFLLLKGKRTQTKNAIRWLRGKEQVEDHMRELQYELDDVGGERRVFKTNPFKNAIGYRAFLITTVIMSCHQLTGIEVVWQIAEGVFYMYDHDFDPSLAFVIFGTINFLTAPLAALIVDRVGRRVLLFASAVSMSACLLVVGPYFMLKEADPASMFFLAPLLILMLSLAVASYNIGIGPIAWILVGEIFAIDIKAVTVTASVTLHWLFGLLVTLTATGMARLIGLGLGWVFLLLGMISALFAVFVAYCVVETRKSSRPDIVTALRGKVKSKMLR